MKENKVLYKTLKLIYSPLLKILYRPKAYGIENIPKKGAIIFAGNHRHAFDPVVVMTHTKRTVHYMAKESLFKGLHGMILKSIGLIKIYRSRIKFSAGNIPYITFQLSEKYGIIEQCKEFLNNL